MTLQDSEIIQLVHGIIKMKSFNELFHSFQSILSLFPSSFSDSSDFNLESNSLAYLLEINSNLNIFELSYQSIVTTFVSCLHKLSTDLEKNISSLLCPFLKNSTTDFFIPHSVVFHFFKYNFTQL